MAARKTEIQKERQTQDRIEKATSITEIRPCWFLIGFMYPTQRGGGRQEAFSLRCKEQSKSPFSIAKASSNHTLGQNILLAIPWVKPPFIEPGWSKTRSELSDLSSMWNGFASVGSHRCFIYQQPIMLCRKKIKIYSVRNMTPRVQIIRNRVWIIRKEKKLAVGGTCLLSLGADVEPLSLRPA